MEIIQQKLIWLMAGSAVLILLYKLKLSLIGIKKAPLARMRAGVILTLFGSFMGIIIKGFFSGAPFSSSSTAFFFETIVGYIFGWTLIIWGLVSWALSYFNSRGKPLSSSGSRIISDIITKSMMRGDSPRLLFNSISRELFSILNCQGLTFHQIIEPERPQLALHHGLTASSVKLLENPRGERNVILASIKSRQAVITDEKHTLHEYSFPETSKGAVAASISIPAIHNGQLFGVLSGYRIKNIPFNEDDLKVLEMAASGLGASLHKEKSDREHHQETRYRELLSIAGRPLDNGEPMISAFIKSAKLINEYLPFKWICLYVAGDGTPRSYEFNLPTGGAVKIIEGWFPKYAFPHLFNRDPNSGLKMSASNAQGKKQTTFIFPIGNVNSPLGFLEFELQSPIAGNSYLPLLGNILARRLALYLKDARIKDKISRSNSWLGALQYFQERAAEINDVSSLLKEIASSTVDLVPTSFCRIMLADRSRKYLKTIALAQARSLNWRIRFETHISLSKAVYHKTALESAAVMTFNQGDESGKLSDEEAYKVIPSEVKCGMIAPLKLGQKTVGLLTIGDCRNSERATADPDFVHFLNALSGMISQVLTWHMEKRLSRDGARKLTLLRKNAGKSVETGQSRTRINSRINGPLAGILAACEYLKSGLHTEKDDFDKYLSTIERNASQIHEITSSTSSWDS